MRFSISLAMSSQYLLDYGHDANSSAEAECEGGIKPVKDLTGLIN